jgi:hypothetical protein
MNKLKVKAESRADYLISGTAKMRFDLGRLPQRTRTTVVKALKRGYTDTRTNSISGGTYDTICSLHGWPVSYIFTSGRYKRMQFVVPRMENDKTQELCDQLTAMNLLIMTAEELKEHKAALQNQWSRSRVVANYTHTRDKKFTQIGYYGMPSKTNVQFIVDTIRKVAPDTRDMAAVEHVMRAVEQGETLEWDAEVSYE